MIIDSLGVSYSAFNFYYDWDKKYRHSINTSSNYIGFNLYDETTLEPKMSLLLYDNNILYLVDRTSSVPNWQVIATKNYVDSQIVNTISASY